MHCWPQHILPRNDTHHLFPLSSSYSRDFRLCHSFNRITKLITHAVIITFLALETKKEMKNSFTRQRSTNLFARVACTSFSLSISIYSIYIFLFLSVSMTERGGNMKRAPSLSTNSPSGRRWTTNEKSEKERETKGGERREERTRERGRRVSDVTLKCLTRLWTSTGGDVLGVKKRREGVAALSVSRSIND